MASFKFNPLTGQFDLDTVPTGVGSGDMILDQVQTVTGAKTFGSAGDVGKLKVAGNTSGSITIAAAATAGSNTITLPAATDTVAVLGTAQTFTANQTISGATLEMSGNISASAWTTNGIRYKSVAGTLTDTSSSGTVAAARTNSYGGNTIAASNSTTFTNYYTTFITEPTAGTNVTLTNKWALGLSGNLQVSSTASLGIAGTSLGVLKLSGNTSGTVTIQTAAAAGTYTLTLPTDDGTANQYLKTDGSGVLSWATVSGGAGTKTLQRFTPLDNQPTATNFATLDTRNSVAVLDFDDGATNEECVFVGIIPEGANLTSGIAVRIFWAATSATSGDCQWGAQFEKYGTDIDSDSWDTATEGKTTTSGTSGIVNLTTLTCTTIDSLAAGDQYRIKIYRDSSDTGNDTMTGDAELVAVELQGVA